MNANELKLITVREEYWTEESGTTIHHHTILTNLHVGLYIPAIAKALYRDYSPRQTFSILCVTEGSFDVLEIEQFRVINLVKGHKDSDL